jgi:hypothetical protein
MDWPEDEGAGAEGYTEPPVDLRPRARAIQPTPETPAPYGEESASPSRDFSPPARPAGASALPQDLWRGIDASALEQLIAKVPLPSPSPTLARLIAKALATGAPASQGELAARAHGLKRAGRMAELAKLTGTSEDSLNPGRGDGASGKATPERVYFLAHDGKLAVETRLGAAERAAALNIIDGETLAQIYREAVPSLPKSAQSPAALRAKLFVALAGQSSAKLRAESIDALLASARDARIESAIAEALADESVDLAGDGQASSFAETGVRIAALAGEQEAAWAWVETGGDRVQSWQLLLGALDASGGRTRAALESGVEIAKRSHLPGPVLQRLVTVLDALGEEVPIPLWDFASRSPEPQDGYLPETGLLSSLKEASDRGEVGRTVLLVAAALGPDGPQGAHLIALGDSLRALRRVGLDAEARRLALEALAAHWPAPGRG